MDTIGIVCQPDHPVFVGVAERLAARGFGVEFFSPREPVDRDAIDELAAFANTVVTRRSFAALRYADHSGIETWNGYFSTTALSCYLVGLNALERLGCLVPSVNRTPGDDNTVTRSRFRWDDGPAGDSGVTYDQVGSEPVTYRYYAVDDGIDTHVQALEIRSKLTEADSIIGETDVSVELATRVRELISRFDARTIAVDFVRVGEAFFALDADPTPQFFGAGLERRIADSLASLTTIGA